MKKILICLFLSGFSLNAYEPFDYRQWQNGVMRDINDQFDRSDYNYQISESNRIQGQILNEIQRQNNTGIYQYGRHGR